MSHARTRRSELLAGCRDTFALILGAMPFGVVFGALAINAGLTPAGALGMSLLVFAGSAQFIAAGLLSQGVGIGLIVATTFVVNLRHALYSASLAPFVRHLPQRWLLPLGFWLTDETYAVVVRRYQVDGDRATRHWYFLGSALSMYVNWQLCTLIGILAGQRLEGAADWGLDVAMVVTFIGIVVPLVDSRPMVLAALGAGLVSILAAGLPHQLGLLAAAASGILLGYLAERRRERRQAAQ